MPRLESDELHCPLASTSTGYNLINGVIFVGEQPRSSQLWDYYVLSGFLEVRNSSFSAMDDGVAGGQLTSNRIKIGGSPSSGNTFDNVFTGMDLESAEKSDFEISYNTSTGTVAAMWAVQYHPWHPFLPSKPSQFLIHNNTFITTGYGASGMFFADDASNPWIQATTWNNTIELQNNLMEGIGAYSTKGTLILNDTVTGSDGRDASGLWNSGNDTAVGNNVSGFTVDPSGYAQIYLDPSTGPKSNKSRRVDLSKQLRATLLELRDSKLLSAMLADKSSIADDLVFPSQAGTVIKPDNIVPRYMEPALEKAGLRRFRFHDLRHTFGVC